MTDLGVVTSNGVSRERFFLTLISIRPLTKSKRTSGSASKAFLRRVVNFNVALEGSRMMEPSSTAKVM